MKLKLRERVDEKRKEALDSINLMMDSYNKRLRSEQQSDGLVIVKAIFGNISSEVMALISSLQIAATDGQTELINNELRLLEEITDVTVPIQLAVQNSRIALDENISKADILGFYDPCPWLKADKKHLLVIYRYRGRLHQVKVGLKQSLVAPMRSEY